MTQLLKPLTTSSCFVGTFTSSRTRTDLIDVNSKGEYFLIIAQKKDHTLARRVSDGKYAISWDLKALHHGERTWDHGAYFDELDQAIIRLNQMISVAGEDIQVIDNYRGLPITANDIDSIITNALELQANYWVGVDVHTPGWADRPKGTPVSTWAVKLLLEGKVVKLYDIEGTDGDDDEWFLTLDGLIGGIKKAIATLPDLDLTDKDNWDDAADQFLQMALFGKIEIS